jgi:TonB dependent receptor
MVLDIHYGLAFQRNRVLPDSVGTSASTLGFPSSYAAQQFVQAIPLLNIGSFRVIGNDSLRNWSHPTHALAATMSWVHGAHTVKYGWDGRLNIDDQLSLDGGAGTFTYGTTFTSGPNPLLGVAGAQSPYDSFAAFLLGLPSSGSVTYSDTWARRHQYHGLFVQDDWHVTPKLTLNLGLRLDIETGFVERYNRQSWFDPSEPTPLAQQTGLPLTGGVQFSGVGGQPRSLWETTHNFGPRAGLAYAITPKTVIRTAYGIFYLPTTQRGYGASTNPGFSVATSFLSTIDGVTPVGSISNPFPSGTIQLVGSSLGPLTLVGSSVSGMSYNTPQPYNQQWNFGIQRELPGRLVVNISYAGSHSVKLPLNLSPNNLQPRYFGAPGDQTQVAYLTALVPNPFFGIIKTGTLATSSVQRQQLLAAFPQFTSVSEQYLGQATSFYNALQVTAQKSYSHGLSMLMAYTWSKNLGNTNNVTTGFLDAVGTPGYQNTYARNIEKSVLATDIPQRLVWNGNYELPFGKGRRFGSSMNPWLNAFAGGWQMNGIWTIQSGFPLSFIDTGTQSFAGTRPSYSGVTVNGYSTGDISSRLGGISGGAGYLNAGAFVLPLSFQLGNVPRLTGDWRAPGNRNLDFSLMKMFPIHERLTLQFRAEAFNILNQVVFSAPNTTVGSATFGIIGSQGNTPRNVQLALKLLW